MSKGRQGERKREEGVEGGLGRKRKSDETERTLSMGFLGGYIQEIRPMAAPFRNTHI